MARPLRVEFPGACYHVINRGNYRRNLFATKGAAEAFIRALGEAAARFGWRVDAYVVMSNHFHLALELTEPNLSLGMKWLQGTWVQRFNRFRGLKGRPFQGRFKAILAEGPGYGRVCHYIHLNPVRAGLVEPGQAKDYPWSSLAVMSDRARPTWLRAEVALGSAGGLPDKKPGWRSYERYLEFLATDDLQKKEMVAAKMSRGWCLGSREFKQEMREEARKKGVAWDEGRFVGLEPEVVREEREAVWEERLKFLAAQLGLELGRLPQRKGHPEKVKLAALLKQSTAVNNAWLASRLQMGTPIAVSAYIGKLRRDESAWQALAKILKTKI